MNLLRWCGLSPHDSDYGLSTHAGISVSEVILYEVHAPRYVLWGPCFSHFADGAGDTPHGRMQGPGKTDAQKEKGCLTVACNGIGRTTLRIKFLPCQYAIMVSFRDTYWLNVELMGRIKKGKVTGLNRSESQRSA